MSQEDDGDCNNENSEGGDAPINDMIKLGDCYLEVSNFDLDGTKKKRNDQTRDTLLITKLVGKT